MLAILPLLAGSPGVGDDLIDYAGRSNDIPLRRRARALKARD